MPWNVEPADGWTEGAMLQLVCEAQVLTVHEDGTADIAVELGPDEVHVIRNLTHGGRAAWSD